MRASLLLGLILAQLLAWDIVDKLRTLIAYRWAVAAVERSVTARARRMLAIARFTTGLRVRFDVDGVELPRRFLVVANHQSVLDIIAIMAGFSRHSVRFVAKRELRRWFPAASGVMRLQRHALIERGADVHSALRELDRLAERVTGNICPVIFPEGTRSRDGTLGDFHVGAVRRLQEVTGLALVALAIDGVWQFARLSDLSRIPDGHQMRVRCVAVLHPEAGKAGLRRSLEAARTAIEAQLTAWRGVSAPDPPATPRSLRVSRGS